MSSLSPSFGLASKGGFDKYDFSKQETYIAQIIRSLMHLMNFTRPDIAYAVCRLSKYTHNPNREHWYNDANWISDSDETKFTSGYVFTLGSGPISWKSAKQTIIARSTMESEFVALKLAGSEAE
ncbi:secreted RxLR effector protein 161-like [Nicotiana sylvestris]|uniref:secreted RxLR effector protein 161-like n=1 Tax=Nicotiana sylvestris TaxID=4096 RepID=UPI00388CC52F